MDESTETVVMQGEVVSNEPPKKRNTALWVVIIVILLLLCCCCALLAGLIWYFWTYGDAIFGLESAVILLAA
jgi:membrane protein YdbS with pleckstrin-like domain